MRALFSGDIRAAGMVSKIFDRGKETNMRQRGKTNRLRAAMKRKSAKKNLRKSRGERKYR